MVKIVADVIKNCLQPLKAFAICGRHLADAVNKYGVESGEVPTQLPPFPAFTHSVQPVFRRSSANSC